MPQKRNRKWWEGSIFLLILLLVSSLVWAVLSQWKRTPHIYAYDDGVNIEKEKELADAGEQENETEKEQQTTPPDEQDNDADTHNPDMDSPDSSDKKQGDDSESGDSEHGTPDGEGGDGVGDEGGGGGTGGGDGDGEPISGSAAPAASPDEGEGHSSTPVPVTATETPSPTEEPAQTTPPPEDKVVSLTCTWADKDTLLYKGSIPRDSIKVKAKYSSGRQVDLDASDYTISGLNNDSIGVHTMTIIYEDVMCRLNYTVNNYIDHIEYDWPTRMKCYKGEVIDGYVLTVTVYMADNTDYDLKDSQYKLTGIDNQKTGVEQTFRITYQGFSVEGTCQFVEQKVVVTDQFYEGQTLQATETNTEASAQIQTGTEISAETEERVTRNGKEYVLKSIKVVVDGREKSLPYEIDERNFDIQITRRYEEG